MTPAERTQAWRKLNPTTWDEGEQRKVVAGWVAEPESCPFFLHRLSYEIRSKKTGRRQNQWIVNGVRFNRSTITWFLLKGEYQPACLLDFAPRLQSISLRSDLE
jgi:hypothetical protein